MSQPTLTARIKQIEESLGTKLLYRGNKGITFTETGEYTVKFAEHILGEMQELRETITNMQEPCVLLLQVSLPDIFCQSCWVDSRICIPKRNLMYRLHKAVML